MDMTSDKLTLRLNGEIPLELFSQAINNLNILIKALSNEIDSKADIEWEIIELESGSATTVIEGKSTDIETVEKIIAAYAAIGAALQNNRPIPYPNKIVKKAKAITNILNGKISSIEFITDKDTFHITSSSEKAIDETKVFTAGAINGHVETLSSRKNLRFILYDALFDRAVTCFFDEELSNIVRDIWGKYVRVTGMIMRDIKTARPLEIHNIKEIIKLPDPVHGSFKSVRGLLPWKPGDELSDQTIRRLRDEE